MRVSEHFNLGMTQPSLEFVDVDIENDTALYIDPNAIRRLNSPWGDRCVEALTSYFENLLRAIQQNNKAIAMLLLSHLKEPNETRLGLSAGRASGRAVGRFLSAELFASLSKSAAVKSGLLEDLEETALMIANVGHDRISDMTTNIIRRELVTYTVGMASKYNMPIVSEVSVGPFYDLAEECWVTEYGSALMPGDRPLLLVPKSIVRRNTFFDPGDYYRNFVLEELAQKELLNPASTLVYTLKNGNKRVNKKRLKEIHPESKSTNEKITLRSPAILSNFRATKARTPNPPLTHEQVSECEGSLPPDWSALMKDVLDVSVGQKGADAFEKAILALVQALFYPSLTDPIAQPQIHEGRKRIDISLDNYAAKGFFHFVAKHYRAPKVFIECKNYSSDPANPELDQLAGRFSSNRGQIGLLICRSIKDKPLFMKRCRDTAADHRGFIIPLDDIDLTQLVEQRPLSDQDFPLLKRLFDALIM